MERDEHASNDGDDLRERRAMEGAIAIVLNSGRRTQVRITGISGTAADIKINSFIPCGVSITECIPIYAQIPIQHSNSDTL